MEGECFLCTRSRNVNPSQNFGSAVSDLKRFEIFILIKKEPRPSQCIPTSTSKSMLVTAAMAVTYFIVLVRDDKSMKKKSKDNFDENKWSHITYSPSSLLDVR